MRKSQVQTVEKAVNDLEKPEAIVGMIFDGLSRAKRLVDPLV